MHPLEHQNTPIRRFAKALTICGALAAATILANLPAQAQEWIPPKCCPETDCQGDNVKVNEVSGGFAVEGVPGIVAYDDPRLQPSQDGRFHACIRSAARPWMSQTQALIQSTRREVKCLFVPMTG